MFPYVISFLVFVVQFLFSLYIGRKIKVLQKRNTKIKEELKEYIEEKEKKYSIKNSGVFRLRVLSIFMKITDEDEKEEIRNYMKSVVKKHNGQPNKLSLLYLTTLVFSVLCIYYLGLLVHSIPVLWLSIVVNILVIFYWISRKRWIFSILFGLFGYWVYPHLPGHIMVYIGLNFLATIIFKINKKSGENTNKFS